MKLQIGLNVLGALKLFGQGISAQCVFRICRAETRPQHAAKTPLDYLLVDAMWCGRSVVGCGRLI